MLACCCLAIYLCDNCWENSPDHNLTVLLPFWYAKPVIVWWQIYFEIITPFLYCIPVPCMSPMRSLTNLLAIDSRYLFLCTCVNNHLITAWSLFQFDWLLLILYFSLCNNSGQTAADLALDYGFLECAKFLRTIEHTQTMKLRGQSGYSLSDRHGLQRENPTAHKQESETSRSINRKRRRSDGM